MQTYTKQSLIKALGDIRRHGWIKNRRPGNAGGVGNTLEDLLGIEENNLPLANTTEWELKTQRASTSSLTTLFHMEPLPRSSRIVPNLLLPKYGWRHARAGSRYPATEMSFRQTIRGRSRTDRGFGITVNRQYRKVLVSFDARAVDRQRHASWLDSIAERAGLDELVPQPYWSFDDLLHKASTKLLNCFYVRAEVRRQAGAEFFHYNQIFILQGFNSEKFLNALENDTILVDFDARTGHNHGTKFRIRQNSWPQLYGEVIEI